MEIAARIMTPHLPFSSIRPMRNRRREAATVLKGFLRLNRKKVMLTSREIERLF
jgi:hypothetical protein